MVEAEFNLQVSEPALLKTLRIRAILGQYEKGTRHHHRWVA